MAQADKAAFAERRSRFPVLLLTLLAAVVLVVGWTALIGLGAIEGWWRRPLASRGDAAAFMTAADAYIDRELKGNIAYVLLKNGQVIDERYGSHGVPVDHDSLFQVASLSKWVSAWGVMKLAEDGRIDIDAPVSKYITRWALPDGEFDETQVTARRLLSHTAGLTDGLGYGGFAPGEPVQPLVESLSRTVDASPGADGRIQVGAAPGEAFQYSGGGYALLQLLVEEVSGKPFNDYMKQAVLDPLGMMRSTYVLPDDSANVAELFDTDGSQAIRYRFSALAPTSLYTSAGDMTRFLQAHVAGANGEPPGRNVIRPETLKQMRRPHAYQFGAEIWGMGTILFAPNQADDFVIGHDGSNTPAINTSARIDPASGDGVIVLETGDPRLATDLAGEWVFWNVGKPDIFMLAADIRAIVPIMLIGWIAILVSAAAACAFVLRRRARLSPKAGGAL